jgi:DNA-binding GntR family transcriptional regulator
MEAISDLPMLNDIDADYSPQYVKLARRLRRRIESGAIRPLSPVRAADLSAEYGVSLPVALAALDMLAANGYVDKPDRFQSHRVSWDGTPAHAPAAQ